MISGPSLKKLVSNVIIPADIFESICILAPQLECGELLMTDVLSAIEGKQEFIDSIQRFRLSAGQKTALMRLLQQVVIITHLFILIQNLKFYFLIP